MSARAGCREMPKHAGNGFRGWQGNEALAVRSREESGRQRCVYGNKCWWSWIELLLKSKSLRVSNQFLLYYMPHILIRINNLHDKQLNNYSSLCGVSLLKSMECRDAVTGKEICNETVGGWHAYTCIAIPCSSQSCEGNYSGEISLSTGWFDFAGSRLSG